MELTHLFIYNFLFCAGFVYPLKAIENYQKGTNCLSAYVSKRQTEGRQLNDKYLDILCYNYVILMIYIQFYYLHKINEI